MYLWKVIRGNWLEMFPSVRGGGGHFRARVRDKYVTADIGCTVCQRSRTVRDISGAGLTSIRTTSCVMSFVRGFQLESSKPHCNLEREAEGDFSSFRPRGSRRGGAEEERRKAVRRRSR